MPYIPDINDLEAALKHLHDPEALRLNPLATLEAVHERVARDQRISGERVAPLPWIYGYELAVLLRSLVDSLDDRDEDLGTAEGRRTTSRPRLYARILKLRFSQGLSWNEVSAEVGRVAGHIQNKLKRPALQMLLGELLRTAEASSNVVPADTNRPITNLPPQGEFIGRRVELEQVLSKLRRRRMPITEICGIGGVGKSELAKRVGWLALSSERLFDAVVWLSAQESYFSLTRFQTVSASNTIRSLGDLLDITARVLGSDHRMLELADKQRQVLSALTSGRFPRGVLLIVDNYESLEASEQRRITNFLFEELPYPSQALITSRHEEYHALVQSQLLPIQVRLGRMSLEDAHACLHHLMQLQQPPLALNAATVEQLVAAADGIPLALLWLLGQLRYSPRSLSQMLAELQSEQVASPLLNYVFDYSYTMLSQHHHAPRLLHALTVFSHGAEPQALAYVADVDLGAAEQALHMLEQLSLANRDTTAEYNGLVRYSTQTLTRVYASGKLTPSEREQAMLRACHYYCYKEQPNPAARPNLLTLIEWAISVGQHQITIDLFDCLTEGNLIGSPTHVQDCDSYGIDVVHACLALGLDERADWYRLYAVCWPQVARRHIAEAQAQLTQLLARAQQNGWLGNQALACSTLGLLYYDQGDAEGDAEDDDEARPAAYRYDSATRYLEEAATLWQQLGRQDWLAIVLGRLAAIKRSSGDFRSALDYYARAGTLYDALGDAVGKALTLRRQAHTLLQQYRQEQQGDPSPIVVLLDQAVSAYTALGDRRGSALSHLYYAELWRELGDTTRAFRHATQAQNDFAYIHDNYGAQRAGALAQQMQSI